MTQCEYQAYLSKHPKRYDKPEPATTPEKDLHTWILKECAQRGWVVFHGSMAHATHRTAGEPDFIILACEGRTILVEVKTRTGKLSSEQIGMAQRASKLGHTIHLVRTVREFLDVANNM
ncbi:MAG: VRR-NUC domain-containing protein [Pyrinomonadaceae bacterium]|nr:VRR-NUC domain-containing protein [Pyrinomonadaceae bacterium]